MSEFNNSKDFPQKTSEAHSGNKFLPDDLREVPRPEHENLPPLTEDVIDNITQPETPFDGFGGEAVVLSPEEKALIDQKRAEVAAHHDQSNTNEEKKKWSLKAKLGAGAAGLAALIGLGVAVGSAVDTAAKPGLLPQAPVATAPAVPGQGEQPLPSVSATGGETISYAPVTEADVKDYAATAADARVTFGEYQGGSKALPVLIEKFNKMLNVRFSDEELANSKHLVSKSGATGPQALLEMKLTAYDDLFQGDGGQFKTTMIKESKENFDKWLATKDEEHPFEVAFVSTGSDSGIEYAYTSNSTENSAADWPNPPKVYKFVAADPVLGPLKAGEQKSDQPWQIAKVTKMVQSK